MEKERRNLEMYRWQRSRDLMPKAVGKWNSLYLDSDQTPWEDDIACAHAAFKALNIEAAARRVAGLKSKAKPTLTAGCASAKTAKKKSLGKPAPDPQAL